MPRKEEKNIQVLSKWRVDVAMLVLTVLIFVINLVHLGIVIWRIFGGG